MPLYLWVGHLGAGKTLFAVEQAAAMARRRGAVLASNIRLSVPGVECVQLPTGEDGVDLDELQALVDRCRQGEPVDESGVSLPRGLVLLLDEVGILMPARQWASFPVSLMWQLSQSRKLRLDVVMTSQDVEQVDSFVRRLVQYVYKVRAFPAPSIIRQERGKRPWFHSIGHWRPATVDKRGKRIKRSWRRYPRRVEGWYDTDELVAPAERVRTNSSRRRRRGSASANGAGRAPVIVVSSSSGAAPAGEGLSEWR